MVVIIFLVFFFVIQWHPIEVEKEEKGTNFMSPLRLIFVGMALSGLKIAIDYALDALFPECHHPGHCFDLVSELRASINPKVDPCSNLYDHVCASWGRNHPRMPSQFQLLGWRTTHELLSLLEKAPPSPPKSAVDRAVLAYHECRAVFLKKQEHLDVLFEIFGRFSFEWPSLNLPRNFDLLGTLVGLSLSYNLRSIISVSLMVHLRTQDRYTLQLQFYYRDVNIIEDIKNVEKCIESVRPLRGVDHVEVADRIVATFMNLWTILKPPEGTGELNATDFYPHYTTLEDIGDITSPAVTMLDWIRVINKHLPSDRQIDRYQDILLESRVLLYLFAKIMEGYISKVNIMLYVGWHIIRQLVHSTTYASRECRLVIPQHSAGELASAIACVQLVNDMAPFALGRLLFDAVLAAGSINFTEKMLSDIRSATEESFRSLHWMDEPTRMAATQRVRSLKQVVGLPSHLLKDDELNVWYDYLPVFREPFVKYYLEAQRKMQDKRKRLLVPDPSVTLRKEDFDFDVVSVNAFYSSLYHTLVINGAILQSPFLGKSATFSYGGIGKILAHELTHAFDHRLSLLSGTGSLVDIYTPKSRKAFEKQLLCLASQVHRATGSASLGVNSISEMFADNAGVEKAYLTFRKAPKSPGMLGYSRDQLFFVSGCFIFCSQDGYSYNSDEQYPPAFLRCNAPAMNEPSFSLAFNCLSSDQLNPAKRCKFH